VIHIKLGPARPAAEDDTMRRDYVGWSPDLSPQELYERNRGRWKLGARARGERYAVFSSTITGTIVLVVEIDDLEEVGGGKSAIVGTVLESGDPVYDGLIGQPSLDQFRNPVTYVDDHPLDRARTCACGCDGVVTGARHFLPGHDQRAIHDRIAAQWGNTVGFIRWFDTTYGQPASQVQA
jgi:hypothetical protein